MKYDLIGSPDYMDSLIVYELCTKQFTSPNGPQSGTFRSAAEKMGYLRELGVNAIWLNGHQLSNKHFGNVWCQYACVRPDELDPTLGAKEDFKYLIDTAHSNGLRVLLDVITHGVVNDSPLIAEHPEWFSGTSWGMTDYDWYGIHPDFEEWWIETWRRYVIDYDIDGFRIDVAHYRGDIWASIRKRCLESGHHIMVMLENGPSIAGVSDTHQHGERLAHNHAFMPDCRLLRDLAGHYLDRINNKTEHYSVKIFFKDGTTISSRICGGNGELRLDLLQIAFECEYIRHIDSDFYETAYEEQMCVLRVENVPEKEIDNVIVFDREGYKWNSNLERTLHVNFYVEVHGETPSLELHFPARQQRGQFLSVQLSCHDTGWPGFPEDKIAYIARGSRYVIGYGCLLSPAIPVFFSGEEFNAAYRPLPDVSPNQSRMLKVNWIDWDDLNIPEKREMLEDVKQILAIRNERKNLVKALRMEASANIYKLRAASEDILPIPYIYYENGEALAVAANPYNEKDVQLTLNFSDVLPNEDVYEATVVFGKKSMTICDRVENLSKYSFEIGRDHSKSGGLLAIRMRRIK
jgi:hypothetical protein